MKAVRREIIDNYDYREFYGTNYGEDLLQTVQLIINANKIYYLSENLYDYRIGTGMMKRYDDNFYWSYKKVNLFVKDKLHNEEIV